MGNAWASAVAIACHANPAAVAGMHYENTAGHACLTPFSGQRPAVPGAPTGSRRPRLLRPRPGGFGPWRSLAGGGKHTLEQGDDGPRPALRPELG